MKKVGILTYFWADNPGTFLQAYATQEAFRKRLPDDRVEMVNYKHRHVFFKPGRRHLNPLQLYRDFKRYRIYEKAKAKYFVLSPEKLISKDYNKTLSFIKKLNYDMLVSGADTILQFLDFNHKKGTVPIYWLSPELECIKVMCGSSCRALTINDLSEEHKLFFRKCINQMSLIGVRDDATFALIKELGLDDESKLELIPDPTFSLDIDYSYAERFVERKKLDFSAPSVMMSFPSVFAPKAEIVRHFKSQGYRVFSLGYAPYADVSLPDISPFEWAGIYKYFDLVLTDRFHGTLFSILNNTPVISIIGHANLISNRGQSKYSSLWSLFGLEQTNCISKMECSDSKAMLDRLHQGIEAFKAVSFQDKLVELKQKYLDFVDRTAALLE